MRVSASGENTEIDKEKKKKKKKHIGTGVKEIKSKGKKGGESEKPRAECRKTRARRK